MLRMYVTISTYRSGARLLGASSGIVLDIRRYRSAASRVLHRLRNAEAVNSPEAWQAVQDARNASRPRSAWVAGTRARFVLPDAPGGDGEASGAAAGGDTSGTPAPGPDPDEHAAAPSRTTRQATSTH